MPAPLTPLPPSLRGRPFTTAEAVRAGLTEKALRHPRLRSPHRGVHVEAALDASDPVLAARAAALVLPSDAAFCVETAVRLRGWPLPRSADRRLHAAVPDGGQVPHVRGVVGHEGLDPTAVDLLPPHGLRVTSAAATFCDMGPRLGLDALVALGDALLWRRAPSATRGQLVDAVAAAEGRRGVVRLRAALPLLSDGAQSPRETALRLVLVRGGIAVPSEACNADVHDADGRWVARPDIALEEARVVVEYDGDHHRERDAWESDLRRRERLERAGWTVVVVTAEGLRSPASVVARVRRAMAEPRRALGVSPLRAG